MAFKDTNLKLITTLLFFILIIVYIYAPSCVIPLTESFFFPNTQAKVCTDNLSWQTVKDEEVLMKSASTSAASCKLTLHQERKKIAFMFLTRGTMPFMPLWDKFFEGQNKNFFSIYRHILPEYAEELPESSVFYKRVVLSKAVEWGRSSMIDAERRLIASALHDPSNEWFVLVSESCIPLFNFSFVRTHLINSHLSFLGSFDDPRKPGRGRYDRRMSPIITLEDWRKGSQWFAIQQTLAINVISDSTYYPVFRNYCRPPCYMDEHYLPTLGNKICPGLSSNRSITWVDWSRGGSHPVTYKKWEVSSALIEKMRNGTGDGCLYNGGKSDVCFLLLILIEEINLRLKSDVNPLFFSISAYDDALLYIGMVGLERF